MKITGKVKDTDNIEIAIYVNGSFSERVILTGAEILKLKALIEAPEPAVNASASSSDISLEFNNKPPVSGDDAVDKREEPKPQAGDASAESR